MTFSRQARMRGVVWGSVILLSAGAALLAFNPQPDPPGHYYGMMTLEAGQHASLHLANVRMAQDMFRSSDLCTARMDFVDACGRSVAGGVTRIPPGASRTLNFTVPTDQLPPGPCADPPGGITDGTRIITADPPGESDPPGARWALRAQVVFSGQAGHCVSNVEVGDPFVGDPTGLRTGGSGFIHPGLIVGFNPQPDPPGAPAKTLR